jgi:hypothetical protein
MTLKSLEKYYGFKIQEDCEKALKELYRLKVCSIRNDDQENDFSDVWFHIQHECDLYEEEEDTELKAGTYNSAKKWLDKYEHLYQKYNTK